MPDEYRFLVFSTAESADALSAYARAIRRQLPQGRVLVAEPVGEKTINGRLTVDDGSGTPAIVPFSAAEVLEALVAYCIDRSIPLPRVSEKTLERLHGRFALRIGHVDSMEWQMRSHAPRER